MTSKKPRFTIFLIKSHTIALLLCMVLFVGCEIGDEKEKEKETEHTFLAIPSENLVDIDGNVYPTTIYGTQVWMAANLKTTRYANGDSILYVEEEIVWNDLLLSMLQQGAWCYYDNAPEYNEEYGKLYNWAAVTDERNLCPQGWRVPSDEEWHLLVRYLDPKAKIDSTALNPFSPNVKMRLFGIESKVAGGYLKSNGSGIWHEPNKNATNKALFNAKPAGGRMTIQAGLGAGSTRFMDLGRGAAFWTSTQGPDLPPPGAIFRVLTFDSPYIEQRKIFNNSGMSVRCIKN
jgi:uncharacterized protein (TIGR02145 family)